MAFSVVDISTCGRRLFVTDLSFISICIIFLSLRFWAAHYSRRRIHMDDILVVFSFANIVALNSVAIWAVFNGLGMHIWELNPSQLLIQIKLLVVSEFTYLLATGLAKLSVLWLYNRIYTMPTFRRWCYGLMVLDVVYIIAFVPVYLTACIPLSHLWDPKPGGYCRDTAIGDHATIIVNLILDLAILILPLPVIWRLQMSVRNKITFSAMFSIGITTIGVMIWRLVVTVQTRSSPDWTHTLCSVGIISSLEVYLGIIAACIPTLGPLATAYVKPILIKLCISKTNSDVVVRTKVGLQTIGGTNTNGRSWRSRPYSELNDLQDPIDWPTTDAGETADCSSESVDRVSKLSHVQGAHVQKDIEAIYKWENGEGPSG